MRNHRGSSILGRASGLVNDVPMHGDHGCMNDSYSPAGHVGKSAATGLFRRYLAVAAVFAVLAVILGIGWADWAPTTWTDWLMVLGLTPAGVAGVLIGDRLGIWLKDQGIGRQ